MLVVIDDMDQVESWLMYWWNRNGSFARSKVVVGMAG